MQRIGFVAFPGLQTLSLAAAAVFEFANETLGKRVSEIRVLSEHGGAVPSSSGVMVDTRTVGRTTFDTIIVVGGNGVLPTTRWNNWPGLPI